MPNRERRAVCSEELRLHVEDARHENVLALGGVEGVDELRGHLLEPQHLVRDDVLDEVVVGEADLLDGKRIRARGSRLRPCAAPHGLHDAHRRGRVKSSVRDVDDARLGRLVFDRRPGAVSGGDPASHRGRALDPLEAVRQRSLVAVPRRRRAVAWKVHGAGGAEAGDDDVHEAVVVEVDEASLVAHRDARPAARVVELAGEGLVARDHHRGRQGGRQRERGRFRKATSRVEKDLLLSRTAPGDVRLIREHDVHAAVTVDVRLGHRADGERRYRTENVVDDSRFGHLARAIAVGHELQRGGGVQRGPGRQVARDRLERSVLERVSTIEVNAVAVEARDGLPRVRAPVSRRLGRDQVGEPITVHVREVGVEADVRGVLTAGRRDALVGAAVVEVRLQRLLEVAGVLRRLGDEAARLIAPHQVGAGDEAVFAKEKVLAGPTATPAADILDRVPEVAVRVDLDHPPRLLGSRTKRYRNVRISVPGRPRQRADRR